MSDEAQIRDLIDKGYDDFGRLSGSDVACLLNTIDRLRAALAAREADGANGACPHCLPIVGAELAKRCAAAPSVGAQAVAVPDGWRVADDGHRVTLSWNGAGYTLDDRHGSVQEAFCGFVRDVVKSAAVPLVGAQADGRYRVDMTASEVRALADYHDDQQEQADAGDIGCTGNRTRAAELRAMLAAAKPAGGG